jgi:hypothetical protein
MTKARIMTPAMRYVIRDGQCASVVPHQDFALLLQRFNPLACFGCVQCLLHSLRLHQSIHRLNDKTSREIDLKVSVLWVRVYYPSRAPEKSWSRLLTLMTSHKMAVRHTLQGSHINIGLSPPDTRRVSTTHQRPISHLSRRSYPRITQWNCHRWNNTYWS